MKQFFASGIFFPETMLCTAQVCTSFLNETNCVAMKKVTRKNVQFPSKRSTAESPRLSFVIIIIQSAIICVRFNGVKLAENSEI